MPGMRTWTSVAPGRQHTTECRQTLHPTSVTDSVWTVRLDADVHERRLEWGWPPVDVHVMKTQTNNQPPDTNFYFLHTNSHPESDFSGLHRPSLSPVMSVSRQDQDIHIH